MGERLGVQILPANRPEHHQVPVLHLTAGQRLRPVEALFDRNRLVAGQWDQTFQGGDRERGLRRAHAALP